MNPVKALGVVLIVAGVMILAYGSYGYMKDSQEAKIGPVVLSVRDKRSVDVPIWVGLGGVAVGSALLIVGSRSRIL